MNIVLAILIVAGVTAFAIAAMLLVRRNGARGQLLQRR